MNHRLSTAIVGALTVGFVLTSMVPSAAQSSSEPAQAPGLYPRVARGEDLIVTDTSGRQHKGELLDAGDDGVLLAPARDRQVFRWSEVVEVRHRKRDSVWNGLLLGLGIGAAGSVLTREAFCTERDIRCRNIFNVAVILPAVAGGTAAGALIDVFLRKEVVVYRPSGGHGHGARLRVTPSIGPNARGVQVALTF